MAKKHHGDSLNSLEELKVAFGLFLNKFQPNVPHQPFSNLFVTQSPIIEKLMEVYNAPSIVNDRNQESMLENIYPPALTQSNIHKTQTVLQVLAKQNPMLHALFNLVIHSIFFAHSKHSGGGTSSSGIGVLWLNSRPHWSQQDILELLIHEMTHTCVFIDEVVHLHINDYNLIAERENFAKSAILATKRPVDKVYHSIIVSVELLESRRDFLGHPSSPKVHPPTPQLFVQTRNSLDSLFSLEKYNELFTPRCQALMKLCDERLQSLAISLVPSDLDEMREVYTSHAQFSDTITIL